MRISAIVVTLILNFTLAGCAGAVSPARVSYILSKPHGWVELTVVDEAIPAEPPKKDEQNYTQQPPTCHISAKLDKERFFSESLSPTGEFPPYN